MHTSPVRRTVGLLSAVVLAVGAGWFTQSLAGPPPASAAPSVPVEPLPARPCETPGPAQRAVENYLQAHPGYGTISADGLQSAADCAAIKAFQARFDVARPSGYASELTGRLVARLNSARVPACQEDGVCVDLTTQTMWVVRRGQLVLGPTVVRTGRPGEETPTGTFRIAEKKARATSTITGTPMRFWQHMTDGYGFHQAWTYLHDPSVPGSLGCVNMTAQDSADLFTLTEHGTAVHIFGRKPR